MLLSKRRSVSGCRWQPSCRVEDWKSVTWLCMQACRGWSLQGSTAVRGSAAAASLRQQGTELAEETLHST